MGTPAANQFEAVLSEKFPGIQFGRVNCRKISDSSSWSQHSWNNGRDLYPPVHIRALGYNDILYKGFLDEVWAFIQENQEALNIRIKLWQVRNHYNHIHVDFWPRGWATPPCAGGAPRYQYPDGTVTATATLINEYTEEEEPDLEAIMTAFVKGAYASGHPNLRPGDEQYWLNLAVTNPTSLEFKDLWKAVLDPVVTAPGIQFGDTVRLEEESWPT